MYHPSLLHPETRERISAAQAPVSLPIHRQLEIALEAAEGVMSQAYVLDAGDLWTKAWRRAEFLRAQLRQ